MEAGPVVLNEGDLFVVPAGTRHNPSAPDECLIMLIERKSTLHTGTVVNEKSRTLAEQLRPVRAMLARVNSTNQVRLGSFGFQCPLLAGSGHFE